MKRLAARIHAGWRRLPPAVRAALITAAQSAGVALGIFVLALVGEFIDWLGDNPFEIDAATGALRAELVAALTPIGVLLHRLKRPPAQSYPDAELEEAA